MSNTFFFSVLKTLAPVTILFLSLISVSFAAIQTNVPIKCKADTDSFWSYSQFERCSLTMEQCRNLTPPGQPTQDTSTSPNTVTCSVSGGGGEGSDGNEGSGNDEGSDGVVNSPPTVISLTNPLKVESLQDLFSSILTIVIILAIPLIVFFIIYSGFLYVTARGNPAQIEQATKSLTYAIIGGVLIVGAVAITEIIKNLVSSLLA